MLEHVQTIRYVTPLREGGSLPASSKRTTTACQYVVLRCVPRVDRDEFTNVGVVVHSQAVDFLDCAFVVDRDNVGRTVQTM